MFYEYPEISRKHVNLDYLLEIFFRDYFIICLIETSLEYHMCSFLSLTKIRSILISLSSSFVSRSRLCAVTESSLLGAGERNVCFRPESSVKAPLIPDHDFAEFREVSQAICSSHERRVNQFTMSTAHTTVD